MIIRPISLTVRADAILPDRSVAVAIATWVLLGAFIFLFLSREAIKFFVLRKFQVDDLFIAVATVLAVGLSVSTLILVYKAALGKVELVTVKRVAIFQKWSYASDLFYISSLCFAKLSLISFFYGLGINRTQKRIVLAFGLFVSLWSAASLIAAAFQCGLPRPWEVLTLHCYDRGLFWLVYCIIDMTTDVAIIMMSVNLVVYLKLKLSRKVALVACFAPRILVIGAALSRLIYLFPITPHDRPEYSLWVPVICTQVQVCLSISTACIPSIKPVFERAESGMWRIDDLRRRRFTIDDSERRLNTGFMEPRPTPEDGTSRSPGGRRFEAGPRISTPVPLSPLTPGLGRINEKDPRWSSPSQGLRLLIPAAPQNRRSAILSPQNYTPRVRSVGSPRSFLTASSPTLGSPENPSPLPDSAHPLISRQDALLPPPPPRRQVFSPMAPARLAPSQQDPRTPSSLPSPPRPARTSTTTPAFSLFPPSRPYRSPPIPQVSRMQRPSQRQRLESPRYLAPPARTPPSRRPSLRKRDSLVINRANVTRQRESRGNEGNDSPESQKSLWNDERRSRSGGGGGTRGPIPSPAVLREVTARGSPRIVVKQF